MPDFSARGRALQKLKSLANEIWDVWLIPGDSIDCEGLLGVQEYLRVLGPYEQLDSQP
jgi:hypothetical protein